MKQYYQFIIKDNKYNSYKKIASLIFFITALLFLLKGLNSRLFFDKLVLYGSSFILFVYAAYMWFYKKRQEKSYFIIYALANTTWLLESPYVFISLAWVVLAILHYLAERDLMVRIAGDNITVHGFLKHNYTWRDFNNIVIKDGLLTLDFKNNKILQVEPDWELSSTPEGRPFDTHAHQQGFKEFCYTHLKP